MFETLLPFVVSGAPLATDPSPNSSPPSRVWATRSSELLYTVQVALSGPASSSASIQAWANFDGGAGWAKVGDAATVAVDSGGNPSIVELGAVPHGTRCFLQVVSTSGSPLSLSAGFWGAVP